MANICRPSMPIKGVCGGKLQSLWTPLNDSSIPAWDWEAGPKAEEAGGEGRDQFSPQINGKADGVWRLFMCFRRFGHQSQY